MKRLVISSTSKKLKKIYEVEVERNNISPRQFFSYCARQFKQKTGQDLSCWVEDYSAWSDPVHPEPYHRYEHNWGDEKATEVVKYMPYDWQLFLSGAYNFIMEYEFGSTDKNGWGYFYALEYER